MERGRSRGGYGRGRGQMAPGMRPVSEASRISIADRLNEFRASPDTELTFEASLNNHDRAIVHDLCKKYGLTSQSSGKGEERRVTVSKPREHLTQTSTATPLTFTPASQVAIYELLLQFPPTELELTTVMGGGSEAAETVSGGPGVPRVRAKKKLHMGPKEVNKQALALASRLQKMPALQQMAEQRARLPIANFRATITEAVDNNQVVLIAGQTGCGKTTQVPQFILDHNWEQGRPCRILCTQPRRISATSVAERIASERGEPVGQTVGYQIRLETKGGPSSSLMMSTTGVLLRKLVQLGSLSPDSPSTTGQDDGFDLDATHIIVDEIHERDRYADFMLIILKDLLPRVPHLRLILMSATLDTELFRNYFGGCPVVEVPGFTHPVKSYYLEDVLALVGYEGGRPKRRVVGPGTENETKWDSGAGDEKREGEEGWTPEDAEAMDDAIAKAWEEDDFDDLMELVAGSVGGDAKLCNYQHTETGATPVMVAAGKGQVEEMEELLEMGADISLQAHDGSTALDWAEHFNQDEALELLKGHKAKQDRKAADEAEAAVLKSYQLSTDQEEVDVGLIERLLGHICRPNNAELSDSTDGAILVFLPGWDDISRARDRLLLSPIFSDAARFEILPLHSQVPSSEQKKVFRRPPHGIRKVILATNIAETAITIDDVVFVVDTGRAKEKSYDPYSNVSTLQMTWISKASAKQREGRAGRVRPGICYHLFSKTRAAALSDFQVPEIKRTPLEELCLQVKLLNPDLKIRDFIAKAVEAPVDAAVRNAIDLLQDIGALTQEEKLTRLGQHLGALPLHPTVSKMLLHAILLDCLDPALTVACASAYRDPFVLPLNPGQKHLALEVRQRLAGSYGGGSDHLALVAAFEGWEKAKAQGRSQEFCAENFLANGVMGMLAGMRQQLQGELVRKGFIAQGSHPCSANGQNPGIIRAVLAAGMYPMVGSLLPPRAFGGRVPLVVTARGDKVRIHPHSANFRLAHHPLGPEAGALGQSTEASAQPLLVYDEITRGEALVTMRSSTVVKPHCLVLIAAEMVVGPLEGPQTPLETDAFDPTVRGRGADRRAAEGEGEANGLDGRKEEEPGAGKEEGEEEEEEDEEEEDEGSEDEEWEEDEAPVKPNPLSPEERAKRRAEELMTDPDRKVAVVVDRWLRFQATAMEAAQLFCLRERLAATFAFRVKHPSDPLPPVYAATMYTIACLFSYEGFLTIPSLTPNHPQSPGHLQQQPPQQAGQQVREQGRQQAQPVAGTRPRSGPGLGPGYAPGVQARGRAEPRGPAGGQSRGPLVGPQGGGGGRGGASGGGPPGRGHGGFYTARGGGTAGRGAVGRAANEVGRGGSPLAGGTGALRGEGGPRNGQGRGVGQQSDSGRGGYGSGAHGNAKRFRGGAPPG